jgi:hypothetical protein
MVFRVSLGRFNVTLCNSSCLAPNLRMRTPCLHTPMMVTSSRLNFFGMGQPMPNFQFQFDLNIPPEDGINAEENVAANADDGWDPWPVEQAQPPVPEAVPNNVNAANNEEEQFSYQLSGLEDLPSDDSVGYFNDIIIPQGVQLHQEEASALAEAVLALPAFPPANINLEGNNVE